MASGGYHAPSNPAPASGPGRLAKRTDGGPAQKLMAPTGMDYGAHEDMLNQERAAAMSQLPNNPNATADGGVIGHSRQFDGVGFDAETTMPHVPVTDGVAIGPGRGPEALSFSAGQEQRPTGAMTRLLQQLAAQAPGNGLLAQLYSQAATQGV